MAQSSLFDPPICRYCGGDASSPNHWLVCDGRQGHLEAGVNIRGLVRPTDPFTSVEAAVAVVQHGRTELQRKIYEAFQRYGPMTDQELLALPEFRVYGPSTVRTRRSELHHAQLVAVVAVRRNTKGRKMLVWNAA
jgi:hypothetical protein